VTDAYMYGREYTYMTGRDEDALAPYTSTQASRMTKGDTQQQTGPYVEL